ncbi:DUF3800 domain-containing protein [Aquirufa ecclesiirivi]|uniref:DUF3800 domain-containing protein n=1 Tax=Aquirufa ecclesiirivi TaxID=2715124 RepID=UPI00140B05D9|nr:DUF3800 domain-containing protein [Aquirufa ecclesiirivi]NHC49868.1 DUF3800 domain-containing protein [Aquirufa ecclesiirivi]
MEERILIFGDEFGTHSLNKADPQLISHFIYTAIAIKESNLQNALSLREEISKKYLSSQKLKSSSKALRDKNNFQKRLDVVKAICDELDCAIYCLIVDKLSLESDGLKFKEVFYKFFQRIFLEQIAKNYNNYSVFMHNIISDEYAIGMQKYLQKKNPSTLFNEYTYKMCTDDEEPLIQIADVLSGSLGRIFSSSHKHQRWEELYDIISPKLIKPFIYPNSSQNNIVYENDKNDEKIDKEIYKIVQNDGEALLNESSDKTLNSILEHLLFYQKIAPFKLVETYELIPFVFRNTGEKITSEQLRRYIRDIRYKGIMVVTLRGKSGYKLASSKTDILNYFSHYMKYVLPMLHKVEIANNIFKGKTTGDFIPLDELEVNVLKRIIYNLNKPEMD